MIAVFFLVIRAYGDDGGNVFDDVFEHFLADGDDAGARMSWAVGLE